MRTLEKTYKFAGLIFRPDKREVEVVHTGQTIPLSQTLSSLLLTLVERPGDVVSYEELRSGVWPHESEMSERVRHTMQVTKLQLVKLLQAAEVDTTLIESEAGRGYRMAAKVEVEMLTVRVSEDLAGTPDGEDLLISLPFPERQLPTVMDRVLGSHSVFIVVSSTFYGMLFWIAMLLEAAYKFDVYGRLVSLVGFVVMLINTISAGSALSLADKRLREGRNSLLSGCGILFAAAIGSSLLAWLCLPNAPVTLSRLQAQPAFAAFLKNALLYILPVGLFALFIPFYFVVSQQLKAEKVITTVPGDALFIPPDSLLVVCLAALFYSLVTTFNLLDNLQTGIYHGLFVTLVFLRFFIYFGLSFGSLLWYRTSLKKVSST